MKYLEEMWLQQQETTKIELRQLWRQLWETQAIHFLLNMIKKSLSSKLVVQDMIMEFSG